MGSVLYGFGRLWSLKASGPWCLRSLGLYTGSALFFLRCVLVWPGREGLVSQVQLALARAA